jgi:hypothetical protein
MAVFISYSHADAEFVDKLAAHLVAGQARVWVDRWELHVGDSLRQRIEGAIGQASAVVVVLSPSALESAWFQQELSAGLVRELEERRVIVLPVLIEDCEIPLFLRNKLYADFRSDFDAGLRQVMESLARVISQSLGRSEEAEGHIDWSIRWVVNAELGVEILITILQHGDARPYSVLSQATVTLNEVASRRQLELVESGAEGIARQLVLEVLADIPALNEFRILLEDAEPVSRELEIRDPGADLGFEIKAICQRTGEDTGRDLLVPIGAVLQNLAAQTRARMQPMDTTQRQRALEILRGYRPRLDL